MWFRYSIHYCSCCSDLRHRKNGLPRSDWTICKLGWQKLVSWNEKNESVKPMVNLVFIVLFGMLYRVPNSDTAFGFFVAVIIDLHVCLCFTILSLTLAIICICFCLFIDSCVNEDCVAIVERANASIERTPTVKECLVQYIQLHLQCYRWQWFKLRSAAVRRMIQGANQCFTCAWLRSLSKVKWNTHNQLHNYSRPPRHFCRHIQDKYMN